MNDMMMDAEARIAQMGYESAYRPKYDALEAEWLEALWVQLGDVRAGGELMKRIIVMINKSMCFWIYRRSGESVDEHKMRCEDVSHSVLECIARRLLAKGYDQLRGVKLMQYVMSLARGYLQHWLKAERRWLPIDISLIDMPQQSDAINDANNPGGAAPLCAQIVDPLEEAELAIVADAIREVMSNMCLREQQCFNLVGVQGMSVREAAEVLGVHFSNVSRCARAGADLVNERLGEMYGEDGVGHLSGREGMIAARLARRCAPGGKEGR